MITTFEGSSQKGCVYHLIDGYLILLLPSISSPIHTALSLRESDSPHRRLCESFRSREVGRQFCYNKIVVSSFTVCQIITYNETVTTKDWAKSLSQISQS